MKYQYYNEILDNLTNVFENEEEAIDEAIDLLTNGILNKNSIFIFGASHAGILTQEMFYRAGGLILINPIFANETLVNNSPISMTSDMETLEGYGKVVCKHIPFKKDDILILHSVSGRNNITIDLAIEAKKIGVKLIGITNLEYSKSVKSRHESGKNLYELVDIVIDNHGEIGDACCKIEGIEQKVGPSSTVVGATILNTIVVEVCKKLSKKGLKNYQFFIQQI